MIEFCRFENTKNFHFYCTEQVTAQQKYGQRLRKKLGMQGARNGKGGGVLYVR